MKSNLDQFFKTNEAFEKDGVWFDIAKDVGFRCKPFKPSNPQVKAAFAAHYKPYALQIEKGTLSQEIEREIQIKMFVQSCLVDWRGVEIDGQPAPFDKKVATEFLMGLPELFDTLWRQCQDHKNYQDEVGESSAAT